MTEDEVKARLALASVPWEAYKKRYGRKAIKDTEGHERHYMGNVLDFIKEYKAIQDEQEFKQIKKENKKLKEQVKIAREAIEMYVKDVYEEFCEQNCKCRLCNKMRRAVKKLSHD